jgi:argininosuccinate lyase
MKMWAGRFRQGLDPEFERWQRSFGFDCRLLAYELQASAAHAKALRNAGILSADELIGILEGLEDIRCSFLEDVEASQPRDSGVAQGAMRRADRPNPSHRKGGSRGMTNDQDDNAEDVHHFVEKQLVAKIGEVGYKLHSGRSRNEQIATDLRLFVRTAIDQVRSELAKVCRAFVDRAEKAGSAAMAAYTHLQHAEPVLVAHWLLAYVEMFLRDAERLSDCRKRVNLCPLGSGAVAGATLALDRVFMAEELEFDAATANSMDATSDRDFAIEFVNALSLLALHLSRWAEELIVFSSQEFGFVQLPEAYSTGSSAMPQKKNPDLLELVRGKSGRIVGAATSLMITMKGLPLAYNKDLQETQQPTFDAADAVMEMLPMVAGFMKLVEFDYSVMDREAGAGFMNAWAAATYLVNQGVPSRLAHEQIGKAVKLCVEKKCELQNLKLDELRELNPAFGETFYECLRPASVLAIHDVIGGTAPARVRQGITAAKKKIEALCMEVNDHAHA